MKQEVVEKTFLSKLLMKPDIKSLNLSPIRSDFDRSNLRQFAAFNIIEGLGFLHEYMGDSTLNPFALHRIKFNATPRTTNIKEKPLHVDVSGPQDSQGNFTDIPDYHICVIYFNDNDGYTYFEDGQKVVSKENRAVIFSGDLLHAGTSCTDADLRVVLNIDYCKWN